MMKLYLEIIRDGALLGDYLEPFDGIFIKVSQNRVLIGIR